MKRSPYSLEQEPCPAEDLAVYLKKRRSVRHFTKDPVPERDDYPVTGYSPVCCLRE